MFLQYYQSPLIETITLAEENSALCMVDFGKQTPKEPYEIRNTPLLAETAKQLDEYFAGIRKVFDLPIEFTRGTDFQKKVWYALCDIPYGETRSYKQIAEAVQSPKAFRAVGMANNKNPVSIIVPCHRVIGASGRLVGYGGGLGIKQALLALEKNTA